MSKILHSLRVILLISLLITPLLAKAEFIFSTNGDGSLNVSGYNGAGGSVIIPSSTNGLIVSSISTFAFQSVSSLTNVMISSNVTSIGVCPFIFCSGLTAITVDANNSAYSSAGGVLFNKNQTILIEYPGGLFGSYTIPGTVTNLADHSFYDCTKLSGILIPHSVTTIGTYAFCYCTGLSTVAIPSSVNSVGLFAFGYNGNLIGVYFAGNAPPPASYVFSGDNNAIIFYLPGATGWGTMFDGQPAVLWNPQSVNVGVRTNLFGFNITGTSNDIVEVEACSNLMSSVWTALGIFTISNSPSYFSDLQWTNYHNRFYRLRSP